MARRLVAAAAAATIAIALAAPANAAGLVALGDSFSSGDGAPPYEPGNACKRSAHAWPLLVARDLELTATSLACSGAGVADVLAGQLPRLAAGPAPDVVTLTIGGNDIGFADVLRRCVLSDCRRHYTRGGRDAIEARIEDLRARLPALYRRVEAAAPRARVLVTGYPRLFPPSPARFTCAALGTISRAEARWLNAKTAAAGRAIAAAARAARVAFVDVLGAFAGGELRCGARRRYVGALFHPNAAGHTRLAEFALAALAARVND